MERDKEEREGRKREKREKREKRGEVKGVRRVDREGVKREENPSENHLASATCKLGQLLVLKQTRRALPAMAARKVPEAAHRTGWDSTWDQHMGSVQGHL